MPEGVSIRNTATDHGGIIEDGLSNRPRKMLQRRRLAEIFTAALTIMKAVSAATTRRIRFCQPSAAAPMRPARRKPGAPGSR